MTSDDYDKANRIAEQVHLAIHMTSAKVVIHPWIGERGVEVIDVSIVSYDKYKKAKLNFPCALCMPVNRMRTWDDAYITRMCTAVDNMIQGALMSSMLNAGHIPVE